MYKNFNENIKDKDINKQMHQINFVPDMNMINYTDCKDSKSKDLFIYENFEIINNKIVELFKKFITIDNNNNLGKKFSECIINDNHVVISFPFENSKYTTLIGKINNYNTFKPEYILIYDSKEDRDKHINKIKYNLNDYLSSINKHNNSDLITYQDYDKFKILGTIVIYNSNNNKKNIIKKSHDNINIIKKDNDEYKNYENNNFHKENEEKEFGNKNNDIDEKEYNLKYKTDTPFITSHFPFPPLIGLQNIGAICYMNATLQCFCHIEKFAILKNLLIILNIAIELLNLLKLIKINYPPLSNY